MIKLTALHYKVKISSLERFHNINQHQESLLFDWERDITTSENINAEYPKKPFIEPFEFEQSDYDITEKKFRIRLKDIFSYKENSDNITELTDDTGIIYTIKETVDELDKIFEISIAQ